MWRQPELKRLRESGVFYRRSDNREKLCASLQSAENNEAVAEDVAPVEEAMAIENQDDAFVEDFLENNSDDNSSEEGDGEAEEEEEEEEGEEEYQYCFENMSFEDGLRYWALFNNEKLRSVDMILALLRKAKVPNLPKSARTLLGTNRKPSIDIKEISGGQYWYHGIGKCLSVQLW